MEDKILIYIFEHQTGDEYVSLNVFFKTLMPPLHERNIRGLFNSLAEKKLITVTGDYNRIGTGEGSLKHNLLNIPIKAVITAKGISEVAEIKRRERQDELLEKQTKSIIQTNSITSSVGESTIKTNDRQKTTNTLTLVIAALSFIAIATSAYFSSQTTYSKELQETNRHLQHNTKILDSMLQSQRGIDSSLQKVVNGSLKISSNKSK